MSGTNINCEDGLKFQVQSLRPLRKDFFATNTPSYIPSPRDVTWCIGDLVAFLILFPFRSGLIVEIKKKGTERLTI